MIRIDIQLILAMSLHLAAGWVVFIFILNRTLNRMPTSRLKLALQVGLLFFFTFASLVSGWAAFTLRTGWARWSFPLAVGLLALLGDLRLVRQRHQMRGSPPAATDPPPLKGAAFLRRPVTTTDLTTQVYDLAWEGPSMKLVHLTDLHLNQTLRLDYFQRAIAIANQQAPDLVFISGDFVTHSHEIPMLPDLLVELETTSRLQSEGIAAGKAVVTSLGNHDYWSDPAAIRRVLDGLGFPVLSGRCQEARLDGKSFKLGADDRPWGKGLDLALAAGNESKEHPVSPALVLSHSPDNIFQLRKQPGVTAVFSGHVHAGQIRFPLPWSGRGAPLILPSSYGRQLDNGHFTFPGARGKQVHLFVSAGIGAAEPALRIYCPPEILVVRFHSRSPGSHL